MLLYAIYVIIRFHWLRVSFPPHPQVLGTVMVLIESVGFGVRDRDLFLYFWDLRDGADWSGWWVTPDFCGNNDYILQAQSDCADPSDVGVGDWRWPRTPSNLTPKAQACA